MRDDRSLQVFLSLEPVQDPEAVCVNECSCVIVWVGSDCCLCSFVRSQKKRYEQFLLLAQNQDQMLKKSPNVYTKNCAMLAMDGPPANFYLLSSRQTLKTGLLGHLSTNQNDRCLDTYCFDFSHLPFLYAVSHHAWTCRQQQTHKPSPADAVWLSYCNCSEPQSVCVGQHL